MSKIGRVNLQLQEGANELGYDTVQEAIADGWEANEIAATLTKKDELEEAHEAWLKEKEKVLEDLRYLEKVYDKVNPDMFIIQRTIRFINRGEV